MEEVGFEMLECEEGWRRRASGGRGRVVVEVVDVLEFPKM